MPISFEWYDEDEKILLNRFVGAWTWKECLDESLKAAAMCRDLGRVDVILDNRDAHFAIPSGALTYGPQIVETVLEASGDWGVTAIVTDSVLVRMLYRTAAGLSKSVRQQYRLASDYDHALDIIYQDRAQKNMITDT